MEDELSEKRMVPLGKTMDEPYSGYEVKMPAKDRLFALSGLASDFGSQIGPSSPYTSRLWHGDCERAAS